MKKSTQFTIAEFIKRYPNDDICLEEIFKARFGDMECCPRCAVVNAKFYRMKKRKCYECGECGHQIFPTADTIMHGSTTKLTNWFFAIYLFSASKNGVSAKELQRQLGVTYKCAWRIGHKIRELMGRDNEILSGNIEIDETLIGGKGKIKRGWAAENKTCLFGMMERNGKVRVTAVDNRHRETLLPIISENVKKGSMLNSDEFKVYRALPLNGYTHRTVTHSKYQWANGDCHTNSIEGYWSNLKKAILGTHTFVSPKWLQNYVNEFDFRHNHRKGEVIFNAILKRINRNI
ncbi:MAG: IS1595 family transposase [Bacteroidia bacterium]